MNVGMTKSIHLTVTFYELEKKRKTQRYRPFSLFENLFLAAGFGRLPPAGALIDGAETRLCLAGEEGAIKSANSLLLAPATETPPADVDADCCPAAIPKGSIEEAFSWGPGPGTSSIFSGVISTHRKMGTASSCEVTVEELLLTVKNGFLFFRLSRLLRTLPVPAEEVDWADNGVDVE